MFLKYDNGGNITYLSFLIKALKIVVNVECYVQNKILIRKIPSFLLKNSPNGGSPIRQTRRLPRALELLRAPKHKSLNWIFAQKYISPLMSAKLNVQQLFIIIFHYFKIKNNVLKYRSCMQNISNFSKNQCDRKKIFYLKQDKYLFKKFHQPRRPDKVSCSLCK